MKKSVILRSLLIICSILAIGLASQTILLFKYGPNWVTGQPLNWFNEILVLIGICAIPGILLKGLKELLQKGLKKNSLMLNNWQIHVLGVLIILCLYLYHIQPHKIKVSGSTGQWLYDSYIRVLVANKFVGPILADEPYHLVINLENRASVAIYIPKIFVTYSNSEVAKLFRMSTNVTFTHEDHIPHHLQPHEKTEISLMCNEILPQIAQLKIYHNLSAEPSEFEINLESISQQPPCPPQLPEAAINIGMSALQAIRRAHMKATTWDNNAKLFACFPADSKTFFDPTVRLKYIEVLSWVVNFCSPNGNGYTVIAKEDDDVGIQTEAKCVCHPTPQPRIGYQEALALANRNHILCADWKSLRLAVGKVDKEYITAWFLPYRGRDSLPLIIDAQTGHKLNIVDVEGEIAIFERAEILQ